MLEISREQFAKIVEQALESLPEKFKEKINNVAIFAEDEPTAEQLKKMRLRRGDLLFGLFEGYAQAKKLNIGPVLPDRITIFRLAILSQVDSFQEAKEKIIATVKHEIAHHFGSDERGAAKASR
ncbi:MAG: metallopeptidase family protein [Patescibacteria group bacterium]|nr:metallopeptidase family protein [Patescibacteria group bacterium]